MPLNNPIHYSSLGINGFLGLFIRLGCICRHLEYDQHPALHAYFIVQKVCHSPAEEEQ